MRRIQLAVVVLATGMILETSAGSGVGQAITWDGHSLPESVNRPTHDQPPFAYLPGDADRDDDFDHFDLLRVLRGGKYQTGLPATWGEGDWNVDADFRPAGDGRFDRLDVMAALTAGGYIAESDAALAPNGRLNDLKTSILYNPATGEISIDAPRGSELTSINIDSAAAVFIGTRAQNLSGTFDHHADYNIFKATFGATFGSITFGAIAQPGLSREFLLSDFTIVGSLDMGGALGEVDLIYIPEPGSWLLLSLGTATLAVRARLGGRRGVRHGRLT